jgi:hypothetical protein
MPTPLPNRARVRKVDRQLPKGLARLGCQQQTPGHGIQAMRLHHGSKRRVSACRAWAEERRQVPFECRERRKARAERAGLRCSWTLHGRASAEPRGWCKAVGCAASGPAQRCCLHAHPRAGRGRVEIGEESRWLCAVFLRLTSSLAGKAWGLRVHGTG